MSCGSNVNLKPINRSTTENSFSDEVFSSGSSSDGMVDDSDYINDSKEKGVFIR